MLLGPHLWKKEQQSILLVVVPITIRNEDKTFDTFALLDSGSEATLIVEHAAKAIELEGTSRPTRFGTFHGNDPEIDATVVRFSVSPRSDPTLFHTSNSLVVPYLNLSRKKCNWPREKMHWSHLADLNLPAVDSSLVTVLLGRDVRGAHDVTEQRKAPTDCNGPDAILTPFGWCVVGPIPTKVFKSTATGPQINHVRFDSSDEQLRDNISKLWDTEAFGYSKNNKPILPSDDQRAMEILEKSIRHTGERQEVALMWKSEDTVLPDNRSAALRHMQQLTTRFVRDAAYAEKYDKVVKEYINLGFASKVDPSDTGTPGRVWYMPHHGVRTAAKPDKVRVVFNCSARFKNVSLNDSLLKGPDLLTSQVGVLLRFRQYPVPVAGDIEKMYHQVQVPEKDRSALRFLYQSPGSTGPVETYQMNRHVFGAISSPTTCLFALRKTAEDQRQRYPTVADLVTTHTYVDNLLYSTESEDDAIRDARDFKALCREGGFNVVQWMSSSRRFLATVAPSELSCPNLDFNSELLPVERTLGILLDWETDQFMFKVNLQPAATMRQVLQELSSIHDPIGLISPVVLPARILMQDIWRCRIGWDDPLSSELLSAWNNWIADVAELKNLRIPRCIRRKAKPTELQLHAFCDASENGFGACIFLRATYSSDNVSVALVIGKSRVAPLRQLSIPRLELQGAVMATRLVITVREELNYQDVPVIYWSDSQTVLQWIHSKTCRYHAFVAHRITEISETSSSQEWRHVPGEVNPADDSSRGIPASSLTHNHRWFRGPTFLQDPPELWPATAEIPEPTPDDPEVSPVRWTGALFVVNPHKLIGLAKSASGLGHFKRIVGWLFRFNRNYPNGKPKTGLRYITAPELRDAMTFEIRVDQHHYFSREVFLARRGKPLPAASRLCHISPSMDINSVLRVDGRLERGQYQEDIKHPIILHDESALARLIIKDVHESLLHASVDRTTHELRASFYILRIKQVVRNVISKCAKCKLLYARPAAPMMAPLPAHRIRPFGRPFQMVGIDYFGPFTISMLRRKLKRYGVMFTCLNTRAVHIEVADSLDTDSFLLAFWRFADRRGRPQIVYSDNGTNLVAGDREIREQLENLDQEKIGSNLANRYIEWKFSPPAAPHFGGAWERLIKSAKAAFRIVANKQTITDEVFRSFMVRVEALLNDRPLTDVPVDPKEPVALSPSHFLIGQLIDNALPETEDNSHSKLSAKSWKKAQTMATHFWRRWMKEYLPNLIERVVVVVKWMTPRRNLAVNDLVLVVDPATPPRGVAHWPCPRDSP